MLHQSAVPLTLWQTLLELQKPLSHSGFFLAGGTSLALRLGHRLSVDLDFFTTESFEPQVLANNLNIGPESITGIADGTLQIRINDIKVEFLKHSYPKLAEIEEIEGIKIGSLPDVAAMKINAIANRGSKKDFYDLAALLAIHPLETILSFYQKKYQPATLLMAIRSLAWFDDAETEPDPISLTTESWPDIVNQIKNAVRQLS
jgi:predicted nucleotidyltransferase component of viral defense system